ncbi:hypothetical protein XBJ2_50003 [Xenorhabdus bovienii str. Jollieti]|nr:hypothetical protein XBJ2_50003 [Xenorhabdus bovienii str. Jollieti]
MPEITGMDAGGVKFAAVHGHVVVSVMERPFYLFKLVRLNFVT